MLLTALLMAAVAGGPASAASKRPTWDVEGAPDPCDHSPQESAHLCGFELLRGDQAVHSLVYRAAPKHGTYNHAATIDYHDGFFLLTWKNSPRDEEQDGQRVLFSLSDDGLAWSPTDGANVMFPNVSTAADPAFLFAEPSLFVGGRRYAAASFRQYSIFPPPPGDERLVLLRRVFPDKSLGAAFWATRSPPERFARGAALGGVVDLKDMDATSQADAVRLMGDRAFLPCSASGSLKCEAVTGEGLPAHEAAHWRVPGTDAEIAMFRHHGPRHPLQWMHRSAPGKRWSGLRSDSNFPDTGSNLNAGALPSGGVYMLNNACPQPLQPHRDPLVVSVSRDGYKFSAAWGLTTCSNSQLGGCQPRHKGAHKDAGPSYPQGVAVVSGKPGIDALYVAFTNNKEDVWVVRVPYSALEPADGQRPRPLHTRSRGLGPWTCRLLRRLRNGISFAAAVPLRALDRLAGAWRPLPAVAPFVPVEA